MLRAGRTGPFSPARSAQQRPSLRRPTRGAGNSGAPNRTEPPWLSSSLNTCKGVSVTITDRMAAWRRERRVLQRVSRAAWRLEQAERERAWALASARAEGVSIRTLAAAAGLVSARVHQITAAAPCGRDRGDRVGASRWSSSRREPTYCYVNRYRPLSFTATSSSPRPGPTSPSTSQRSRGLCAGCGLFLGTNDRPVKRLIMAGYPFVKTTASGEDLQEWVITDRDHVLRSPGLSWANPRGSTAKEALTPRVPVSRAIRSG